MKTKLPNFLIVGAAKAGTTSLYNYLKEHPDIYLSDRKEGLFLSEMKDFDGENSEVANKVRCKSLEEYKTFFKDLKNEKCIGDISPECLYYHQNSIKNIKKYLKEKVKIIIILRNPIDRAYSQYTFYHQQFLEELSFPNAIKEEPKRKNNNWRIGYRYLELGLYYQQVKDFKDNFNDVLILDFNELKINNNQTMEKILNFLEVDSDYKITQTNIHNKSGMPKNKSFHLLLLMIKNSYIFKSIIKPILYLFLSDKLYSKLVGKVKELNIKKSIIDLEMREQLKQHYYQDVKKLQNLVEFDVMKWVK
jgi:hypothetical protein